MHQQDATDFPPNAEIAAADVRAAVHEFAETGARPTRVRRQQWQAPTTTGMSLDDFDL
jgi:hypothetical protein